MGWKKQMESDIDILAPKPKPNEQPPKYLQPYYASIYNKLPSVKRFPYFIELTYYI